MADRPTSLLGLPIIGEYQLYNDGFVENQRSLDELKPILQALLDDPEVARFGWVQYTPYFNDGDACVFGIHGCWVLPQADRDNDDFDHWEFEPNASSPQHWRDFEKAIYSGEYFIALLQTFGDPASITFDQDTIKMEYYEHD
jgi:hypothetical protein